jgi:hypothetical protein
VLVLCFILPNFLIQIDFNLIHSTGSTLFCHGDMQPNNILFKVDSDGRVTNKIEAVIDWQLIFAGIFLIFGISDIQFAYFLHS